MYEVAVLNDRLFFGDLSGAETGQRDDTNFARFTQLLDGLADHGYRRGNTDDDYFAAADRPFNRLGRGQDPGEQLVGGPSDRCYRRDSKPLVDLHPARVVDKGCHIWCVVELLGDASRHDVGVVTPSRRHEDVRVFDTGFLQDLAVEADAYQFLAMEPAMQAILELRRIAVDDRNRAALCLKGLSKLGPHSPTTHYHRMHGRKCKRVCSCPMNRIFKRIFVGKPISTHEELHHRLSKKIALAVFSSDALSSSAYATDEILLVLVLAGAGALTFGVPIAMVVAVVLTVVVASYRQTVKAFPTGGGAYRVAKSNLGAFSGLIAASALLIDYVLTVSVSVAAGMAAVSAAFPGLREHRLGIALGIVAFVTALNLRGLKESGTVFAVPTYGFLLSMGAMILFGAYKALTGGTPPVPESAEASRITQSVSLFLIARAFASGSTALTGIEAISDGVPAFKKPESKNAAQTLMVLGFLLTFLFLGVTFLAQRFSVDPHLIEEGKTVTSQIAGRVFGSSSIMFFAIQVFTALILFLAANTSYADFPRLASILATDRYLPRALQNRGDRLAFSNGILALAGAACSVLWIYKADVHKIIPLYVVGVFTSFTLSQSGMVRHTLRGAREVRRIGKPEPRGWRRGMVISGFGAFTTFIVLIIVSITKFKAPDVAWTRFYTKGGAWQVIALIPLIALILYKIKAHYDHVAQQLRMDRSVPHIEANRVVLVVSRLRGATKALAFARAIAPRELRVVSLRATGVRLTDLRNRWESMGVTTPIETVGDRIADVVGFIKSMSPTPEMPVTVILPDPQYPSALSQLLRSRFLLRMKGAFLYEPGVVVVSVPFRPLTEPEPKRLQAPGRLSIIVVVSAVHRATVRAIRYATSLNPSEIKALSIQTDPGEAAKITGEWADWKLDVPLEIVDSPYRSLIVPLMREIRELRPNPDDAVAVVVPEFLVPHFWQRILHNQTALLIKFALLFEPNVVVINVPYRLDERIDSTSE